MSTGRNDINIFQSKSIAYPNHQSHNSPTPQKMMVNRKSYLRTARHRELRMLTMPFGFKTRSSTPKDKLRECSRRVSGAHLQGCIHHRKFQRSLPASSRLLQMMLGDKNVMVLDLILMVRGSGKGGHGQFGSGARSIIRGEVHKLAVGTFSPFRFGHHQSIINPFEHNSQSSPKTSG